MQQNRDGQQRSIRTVLCIGALIVTLVTIASTFATVSKDNKNPRPYKVVGGTKPNATPKKVDSGSPKPKKTTQKKAQKKSDSVSPTDKKVDPESSGDKKVDDMPKKKKKKKKPENLIPPGTDVQHLDDQCESEFVARATPEEKEQHAKIPGLLRNIAMANIRIIQEDTIENANKSMVTDIGPFVDAVEEAIDTIGIYPMHTLMMRRRIYAEGLNKAAEELGIKRFRAWPVHKKAHQATLGYQGKAKLTDRKGIRGPFTGHWFWIMHWVGAAMSDKLIREGSLLVDSITGQRMTKPEEYYQMIIPMQRASCPDIFTFHAQHGFIWHYVGKIHKDKPLTAYPADLVERCCGDLARNAHEYIDFIDDDMARECVHGFGHSLFVAMAMQKAQIFDVRIQFRQQAGFELDHERYCEVVDMCFDAEEKFGYTAKDACFGGFGHSVKETTGDEGHDFAWAYMEEKCGYNGARGKKSWAFANATVDTAK